ncbi:MAG TPA: quinolinate synthase NadA [Candidatus Thermoplasmatota archaeon]|nr:quinolinate synthase NadA [Candidatus Thermoplasmatota archaeon]
MNVFGELPLEYRDVPAEERRRRIVAAKAALGDALVILGHNYQNDEIVSYSDHTGDSYQLSVAAARNEHARHIVFCGVSFMAETADILTDGRRDVVLPSMEASCPMAGMAEMVQVAKGWQLVADVIGEENLVPVAYINSYADLKAFVGEKGGVICTSANADKAFRWAWEKSAPALAGRRPVIVFFPDKHLATNTALDLGIPQRAIAALDPWRSDTSPDARARLAEARVVAWEGYCQVHDRFKADHVRDIRAARPGIQVVVHPECRREVVELADHVGSTSKIIEIVAKSPAGSSWAIGTEVHLVRRLANDHPDKYIVQLCGEACLDCNAMRQVQPEYLLWVLEELVKGRVQNRIQVPDEERALAKVALQRMLEL